MCADICHRIPDDLTSSLNKTGFFGFCSFAIHLVLVFRLGSRMQQIYQYFLPHSRVQENIYL